MKQQLYINEQDAYETWGIMLDTKSLSALMTPAPSKALVSNTSRLENGKRVINKNQRLDARDVTLTLQLVAPDETTFFSRYKSFCEELAKGRLEIYTAFDPNTLYRFDYISCQQFTQFLRQMAFFSLKLNEPDPTNRSKE